MIGQIPIREVLALSLGRGKKDVTMSRDRARLGPFGGPASPNVEENGGNLGDEPRLIGEGFKPTLGRIGLDDDRSGAVDAGETDIYDAAGVGMAPDEDILNRALAARQISREELMAAPDRFGEVADEYHRIALVKRAAAERIPLDAGEAVAFDDLYKTYQERRSEAEFRQARRAAARRFQEHVGMYASIQEDLPPDATMTVDMGGGRKLTLKGGKQGLLGSGMLDAAQAAAIADQINEVQAMLPPGRVYEPDLSGETPGKIFFSAAKFGVDNENLRLSTGDRKLRDLQIGGLKDLRGSTSDGLKELLKLRTAAATTDAEILAAGSTDGQKLKAAREAALAQLGQDFGPEMKPDELLHELAVHIQEAQTLERVAQWQEWKMRTGQTILIKADALHPYYGVDDPEIQGKMDEMRRKAGDWRGEEKVEQYAARWREAMAQIELNEEMNLYNPYHSAAAQARFMPQPGDLNQPTGAPAGGPTPAPSPTPRPSVTPGGATPISQAPTQGGAADAAGNPTAPPVGPRYKKLTESEVRLLAQEKGVDADTLLGMYEQNGLLLK